jgi:hypothetical protein
MDGAVAKKYVIRMNMNRKYHTREHYEIILLELLKLAGKKNIDVRAYSHTELLIQINNFLAFFNVETYSLDEIEIICDNLKEEKLNVA